MKAEGVEVEQERHRLLRVKREIFKKIRKRIRRMNIRARILEAQKTKATKCKKLLSCTGRNVVANSGRK